MPGHNKRTCPDRVAADVASPIVERDIKPANVVDEPPPQSKSDRFARIEAAARARRLGP